MLDSFKSDFQAYQSGTQHENDTVVPPKSTDYSSFKKYQEPEYWYFHYRTSPKFRDDIAENITKSMQSETDGMQRYTWDFFEMEIMDRAAESAESAELKNTSIGPDHQLAISKPSPEEKEKTSLRSLENSLTLEEKNYILNQLNNFTENESDPYESIFRKLTRHVNVLIQHKIISKLIGN